MKSYHSSSSSWCWLLFPEERCDVIVRSLLLCGKIILFWRKTERERFLLVEMPQNQFIRLFGLFPPLQKLRFLIQHYISLIIIFMEASTTTSSSKTPADFLKSIRGKRVVVKLNSGVDYRGILTHTVMNFAVSQGRRKKEIVRSFVRLLLYYTTTLVHINRVVVRDIDTSSSSSSSCKTGILACLDGYMNIAMEHTEVRTDCRLFS